MSWLFSRALVEEYLGENSLDGEQSAPLSGNPTPRAYCAPDKMTDFSRLSRYGMMYKPLTETRGEELLTLYREVSRVRTSALPEKAQESPENGQECGPTWRGSLARFDPASSSWRTAQPSLLGDSDECSVIWPRSGMTAGGQCWELPMLGRRTRETDSGLLPTPTVFDSIAENMMPKNGDTTRLDKYGKARKVLRDGRTASMGLARLIQHDATTANDSLQDSSATLLMNATAQSVKVIANAQKWPTPKVQDSRHAKTRHLNESDDHWKSNLGEVVSAQVNGGSLNPTWVEWLMGWPLGWTDLKPLETDKSPCVQQQLGES